MLKVMAKSYKLWTNRESPLWISKTVGGGVVGGGHGYSAARAMDCKLSEQDSRPPAFVSKLVFIPLCLYLWEEALKSVCPLYLVSMSPLPGAYVPSTWCLCPLYLEPMSPLPGAYVPSTWCLCPLYLVSMSPLPGVYVPSTWCLCPLYLVSMSPLPSVYAGGSRRSHTGGKCVTCLGLTKWLSFSLTHHVCVCVCVCMSGAGMG